jgi:hypothetical protein
MSLTEPTTDDYQKLRQLRIERLRHFFAPSLSPCLIQINADDRLAIHCPHPGIVDELLNDLEDLCHHTWSILGVHSIGLYFCQEEIFYTQTVSSHIGGDSRVESELGRRARILNRISTPTGGQDQGRSVVD